jgi:GNAT superfamily N-acetyltransferase
MKNMEQISIEQLQVSQLEEATEVLVHAFSQKLDPSATLRERRKEERINKAVFGFMLKHLPGVVLVAKKDNRIIGVMRMAEWPRCQVSLFHLLKLLPSIFFEMRSMAPHMLKRRLIAYRKDPKKHHWHLAPIGVVPELQKQGIGMQLLTKFCEKVDAANAPAYLETDTLDNVRLYQRFGFLVTGETRVSGVRFWLMWRQPHGNGSSRSP